MKHNTEDCKIASPWQIKLQEMVWIKICTATSQVAEVVLLRRNLKALSLSSSSSGWFLQQSGRAVAVRRSAFKAPLRLIARGPDSSPLCVLRDSASVAVRVFRRQHHITSLPT